MNARTADAGEGKKDWAWLPAHMPGVAALIAEHRRKHGSQWVNAQWTAGVLRGEPGHFWACEGPLCVGTPPPGWAEAEHPGQASGQALWQQTRARHPGACLLVMPEPQAGGAA